MQNKWFDFKLHESVGVITWGVVFAIAMKMIENAAPSIQTDLPFIVIAFVGYLLAFLGATRDFNGRLSRRVQALCFTAQLGCAFAILWMLPLDFLPILTIIWAAVSLSFFTAKQAIFVTTLVVITWFSVYGIVWEQRSAFYSAFLYYSFHIFALMMSLQTKRAEEATAAANALNTELQATRELLAESTKVQERTRIARELHDLLGHHLTALNINLQVASHLISANKPTTELKQPVEQSYLLAKLLLSDVREAVSTIRDNQSLDLSKAIGLIAASFPDLEIQLKGDSLPQENIELLHDLLRCIQECVTNAVKHGQAKQVSIDCQQSAQQIKLVITDDGHQHKSGTQAEKREKREKREKSAQRKNVKLGNGLTGMQERLANYHGDLDISIQDGQFRVEMTLPQQSHHLLQSAAQPQVKEGTNTDD